MNDQLILPPQSLESESSVLGSMMLDANAVNEGLDILTASDFYASDHQKIFSAIAELSALSSDIDVVTVSDYLANRYTGHDEIKLSYLTSLSKNTPYTGNASNYAKIVKEKSKRRAVIQACNDVIEMAYHDESSSDVIIDRMTSKGFDIAISSLDNNQSFANISPKIVNHIEKNLNAGGGLIGFSTGLKLLDIYLSGMQKGKLYVIGGRPGHGKTTLAMNIIESAIFADKTAQFFTLEMTNVECGMKMACSVSRVEYDKIQTGKMNKEEWSRFNASMKRVNNSKFFIDDSTDLNMAQVKSRSRKIKQQHGLDLIVVDYLGLMRTDESGSRVNDIAKITREMKNMAKDLDCAVILVSQLNRGSEHSAAKRPTSANLRDSGSIEQDANTVILVHREEVVNENTQDKGIGELIVTKNRSGKTGTIRAKFIGQFQRFDNFQF